MAVKAVRAKPAGTILSSRPWRTARRAVIHALLILVGISCLLPFIWMISTSFKEPFQVFTFPPEFIPNPWSIAGYQKIFTIAPIGNWVLNSLYVASVITVCQLLFSSLAAYAFARIQFPGRDVIFMGYLATMMVPGQVTLIPGYILMKYFGWIDTMSALTVPFLFGSAFGTFLLRQFFMTIPMDLEDAAKIDGCSYFGIYWRIMLPLIKPALAAVTIWTFMGAWNNFMGPLIYISSPEKMPLAYALQLFQSQHGGEPGMLMAAATMVMLPVLVLFFFTQRYFIEGVTLTGIKG